MTSLNSCGNIGGVAGPLLLNYRGASGPPSHSTSYSPAEYGFATKSYYCASAICRYVAALPAPLALTCGVKKWSGNNWRTWPLPLTLYMPSPKYVASCEEYTFALSQCCLHRCFWNGLKLVEWFCFHHYCAKVSYYYKWDSWLSWDTHYTTHRALELTAAGDLK